MEKSNENLSEKLITTILREVFSKLPESISIEDALKVLDLDSVVATYDGSESVEDKVNPALIKKLLPNNDIFISDSEAPVKQKCNEALIKIAQLIIDSVERNVNNEHIKSLKVFEDMRDKENLSSDAKALEFLGLHFDHSIISKARNAYRKLGKRIHEDKIKSVGEAIKNKWLSQKKAKVNTELESLAKAFMTDSKVENDDKCKILGKFCLFRLAYTKPNAISISTVKITEDEHTEFLIFENSRNDSELEINHQAKGAVFFNSPKTVSLMSIVKDGHEQDAQYFLESLYFRFRRSSWLQKGFGLDGIYTGMFPANPRALVPFATRAFLLPIKDESIAPEINALIGDEDFTKDNALLMQVQSLHEKWLSEQSGSNIPLNKNLNEFLKEIRERIELRPHKEYGFLSHYHDVSK